MLFRAMYSPAVLEEAKSVGPLQKELLLILKEIRVITEKVKEIQFLIEKSLKGGRGNQSIEVNLLASKYKIDLEHKLDVYFERVMSLKFAMKMENHMVSIDWLYQWFLR